MSDETDPTATGGPPRPKPERPAPPRPKPGQPAPPPHWLEHVRTKAPHLFTAEGRLGPGWSSFSASRARSASPRVAPIREQELVRRRDAVPIAREARPPPERPKKETRAARAAPSAAKSRATEPTRGSLAPRRRAAPTASPAGAIKTPRPRTVAAPAPASGAARPAEASARKPAWSAPVAVHPTARPTLPTARAVPPAARRVGAPAPRAWIPQLDETALTRIAEEGERRTRALYETPRRRSDAARSVTASQQRAIEAAWTASRPVQRTTELTSTGEDLPWPSLLDDDEDAPDLVLAIERRQERADRLAREQRSR